MSYALRFTALDKDQLKASFIDYLKNTSEFQNFNFEASGMSALLDMLAYNAYHHALMANMQFNEIFLDTAVKRQNVISRANELGYTPFSSRASKATLSVSVKNVQGNPSSLVLPAGATFTTTVNNQSYNFVTLVPYSAYIQVDNNNIPFYLFTVDVFEGLLSQNSAIVGADPSIDIMNMAMDTTTLRVFVTIDNTEYEFYAPDNFLTITPDNKVYFVTEGYNAYKITFGDNSFGLQPPQNSLVRCTYLLTSGSGANEAASFSFTSSIPNAIAASVSVTTTSPSQGGTDSESIDSIKLNAVNYFTTQDRAVTTSDYKSLVSQVSDNVKDVLTWGGETNNPPVFGKVIVCVQPKYGDALTTTDKTNIQTLVAAKAVPNIGIQFVDPVYLNLVVSSVITYDINIITVSTYDLQSIVQSTISNFVSSNLSKFNGKLHLSNLISAIDRTDSSIISNNTTVTLKYKYIPTLYQTNAIQFSFNNQLDSNNRGYVIKSTVFYVEGQTSGVWIEDDDKGNLNLFYTKNGVKSYAAYNIGTVDYLTGDVYISGILITGMDGLSIDFVANLSNSDIQSINETIINIDSSDISVTTKV